MTFKPKPQKAPQPRADVEVGDHIYVHHSGQPCAGVVRASGRHGCTVDVDGQHHKVKWDKVLGHKKRAQQRYEILDHGEDGMLVQDASGKRRFVALTSESMDDPMALKSLLAKTWVPAKKRTLASGKVVDVRGYYDPRSPKRGYQGADGWVDAGSRSGWLVPSTEFHKVVDESLSPKEQRRQAVDYAKEKLIGSHRNHESNWVVGVGRNAIDECLSHGGSIQMHALSAIPGLILHGAFRQASQPRKEKHAGTDIFWYAVAPVHMGDAVHVARIVVRQSRDGKYNFYDLQLSKKVDGADLTTRNKRVAVRNHAPSGTDSSVLLMSVSDMERYLNDRGRVLTKSENASGSMMTSEEYTVSSSTPSKRSILLFFKSDAPGKPVKEPVQPKPKANGDWAPVEAKGAPAQQGQHVAFRNGELRGHGRVAAAGEHGVTVQDKAGGQHRVLHDQITHHWNGDDEPGKAPPPDEKDDEDAVSGYDGKVALPGELVAELLKTAPRELRAKAAAFLREKSASEEVEKKATEATKPQES